MENAYRVCTVESGMELAGKSPWLNLKQDKFDCHMQLFLFRAPLLLSPGNYSQTPPKMRSILISLQNDIQGIKLYPEVD
jgi:hypothetical protein